MNYVKQKKMFLYVTRYLFYRNYAKCQYIQVGSLEFNVPFQHKYGYIRDDQ